MTYAWIIVSALLGVVWLIAFCAGMFFIAFNGDGDYTNDKVRQKKDFQEFASVMFLALLVVFFHWILVLLALLSLVPLFILYGSWQTAKFAVKRPWKKKSEDLQ